MGPAKLQPALLGGLAMGVLSALPIINAANCCCAWILFGGGLAAYLMQQNYPGAVSAGDGAVVGLLAGIIGAVVWSVLSIPIGLIMGPFQIAMFERLLENARDVPPEVRDMLETMRARGTSGIAMGVGAIASFFFMLFIGLFVGAIFGALGGILGAVMFRKNVPPPPPPSSPFSPPPPPSPPMEPPTAPPPVPGTV